MPVCLHDHDIQVDQLGVTGNEQDWVVVQPLIRQPAWHLNDVQLVHIVELLCFGDCRSLHISNDLDCLSHLESQVCGTGGGGGGGGGSGP